DDGALDLCGRVLHHRAPRLDGREHRDAAGVPEPQRAPHVGRVEQILDGDAIGTALGEQHCELAMDPGQPQGKGLGGAGADRPAGHETMPAAVGLHAPVAGAPGARIDAEDSHAREASISFSSMSKLAQTCWTSSWSSSASISLNICCASLPCSFT